MASLWQLFIVFAKIGAFTIGGGYAMLQLIEQEIVGRGWLDEKEFPDIIALAQSAPGLIAVNISIFIGYRIRGTKGSIVTTLGSILPPFLIILIIAIAFSTGIKNNPVMEKIFMGIRPAVISLILVPMIKMAKSANRTWWAWMLTGVSLILVGFLKVSPIYILIVTIILGVAVSYNRQKADKKEGGK